MKDHGAAEVFQKDYACKEKQKALETIFFTCKGIIFMKKGGYENPRMMISTRKKEEKKGGTKTPLTNSI